MNPGDGHARNGAENTYHELRRAFDQLLEYARLIANYTGKVSEAWENAQRLLELARQMEEAALALKKAALHGSREDFLAAAKRAAQLALDLIKAAEAAAALEKDPVKKRMLLDAIEQLRNASKALIAAAQAAHENPTPENKAKLENAHPTLQTALERMLTLADAAAPTLQLPPPPQQQQRSPSPQPQSHAQASAAETELARLRAQMERERAVIEQQRLDIERERAQLDRDRQELQRAAAAAAIASVPATTAAAAAALSDTTENKRRSNTFASAVLLPPPVFKMDDGRGRVGSERVPSPHPGSTRKLPAAAALPPPLAGDRRPESAAARPPSTQQLPSLSPRQQAHLKQLQAINLAEKEVQDMLENFSSSRGGSSGGSSGAPGGGSGSS